MDINHQLVSQALIDTDIPGPAREEAARLVEEWVARIDTFPETQWSMKFVEGLFYIQLEPKTYIVGAMDGCFHDGSDYVFTEWKSRRAPKLKKDGNPYQGDDEEGWLSDISNGPQLGVYALAARSGVFVTKNGERIFGILEPRILVRAAVKSNPVVTWPSDYRKGLFTFPSPLLDNVRSALLSEAASIRARRKLGSVPYSLPGIHCTNMYRRTCEYLEPVCLKRTPPPITPVGWHHPLDTAPDPGLDVCKTLGLSVEDPELVVLSASALVDNYHCAEKARIDYGGYFQKNGDQFELNVGTGLHKALASIYRQWPEVR